jgi:aspartate/methionine/tyrosine aminotransferase
LGYVAAPPELIGAMIRIHQNIAVCATTFVQWGGVEALNGPADEYKRMVDEFDRRRKMVCQCLTDMRGVKLVEPKGAFYVFPNIEELGVSSEKLTWYLLDQAKIAVVPGTTLGDHAEGYIRISYANSYENLQKAMDRMSEALNRING